MLTIDAAATGVATDRGTAVGVAVAGEVAYSSARRVYVAATEHGEDVETRRVVGETTVYAFDATGRDASPRIASGTVPGLVSDPAAFSERGTGACASSSDPTPARGPAVPERVPTGEALPSSPRRATDSACWGPSPAQGKATLSTT